jgi:hypothetical protein
MPTSTTTTDFDPDFVRAAQDFWHVYYNAIRRVHEQESRALTEPVRDRNLSTTDSKHVVFFEEFCRHRLAQMLGVPVSEVGKRTVRFKPYRSKSFDVCWPLNGEPRVLISVKSMQNAYRNFTNRIEEAFGDSAVLRVYNKPACFGFFFFMVDGPVARGRNEMAPPPARLDARGQAKKTKGAQINLALLEEGGDFFNLGNVAQYRQQATPNARRTNKSERKDVVAAAQKTLLDLVAEKPSSTPTVHYDAMAFVPACIQRIESEDRPSDWKITTSSVDSHLAINTFFSRLVDTAKLRGFV